MIMTLPFVAAKFVVAAMIVSLSFAYMIVAC
jgi:hypothetical protein